MKYISLFAGIGGFDLALNRLGHECVYVNEWDKYAAQIYEKNFGHKPDTTSITDVPENEIPDHDLLVGGFPCQTFSIAGKRKGFAETRGTLFFDICRIARAKRTKYLLLENVEGLLSHDNGKTFSVIIQSLDELGYDLQWQVLNSKDFGVPQNRERIFIVGHLRGNSRPQVFPFGVADEIRPESSTAGKEVYAGTLTARQFASWNGNYIAGTYRTHKDGNGFRELKQGISPTIPARVREDGSGQPVVMISNTNMNGQSYEHDYAGTLRAGASHNYQTVNKVRRLTPIECERLQGFPDNWTEGVSDAQRYKQLGNAVTVNVVQAVASRL